MGSFGQYACFEHFANGFAHYLEKDTVQCGSCDFRQRSGSSEQPDSTDAAAADAVFDYAAAGFAAVVVVVAAAAAAVVAGMSCSPLPQWVQTLKSFPRFEPFDLGSSDLAGPFGQRVLVVEAHSA